MQLFEDFEEYCAVVRLEALKLGLNAAQVRIFYADIQQAFEDGLSVEDAVQEIF